METNSLKNIIVLKSLPSNIIEEAIIILKSNKYAKKFQTIEKKSREDQSKIEVNKKEYIIKWTTEYKYDISIIELALKKTSPMNSISFEYFDRVLTDWHEKGLNTVEEILIYQQSQKDKTKKRKQIESKIPEYSYTQSTFDNLESLYDN